MTVFTYKTAVLNSPKGTEMMEYPAKAAENTSQALSVEERKIPKPGRQSDVPVFNK